MISKKVKWPELKTECQKRRIGVQYRESSTAYFVDAIDGQYSISCYMKKGSADAADFESSLKLTANRSPKSETVTQLEKNDKDLKLFKMTAATDAQGLATCSIKIPGSLAAGEGRFVAWGEAFFDIRHAGDAVVNIQVADRDGAVKAVTRAQVEAAIGQSMGRDITDQEMQAGEIDLGGGMLIPITAYPLYPVLKSYHDEDVPEANRGAYIPVQYSNVEVEPVGGYGFINAELYLEVTGQKTSAINPRSGYNFYVNVDAGRTSWNDL